MTKFEMYYLISYTLTNLLLVLLIVLSVVISILVILPAVRGLDGYLHRFRIAVTWAVVVGFIFGILKGVSFIVSNRYLQYKMYYLASYVASSTLNSYLLIALGAVAFVFTLLPAIGYFLKSIGANRRVRDIIACGTMPALLTFVIGGYWINRVYLPELFGLKSVLGNALWITLCILLGYGVGWLILKISQIRFGFSRVCGMKGLVGVIGLVILFNAPNLYLSTTKTDRPNVILISIDTLRADHLGCYGYHRNTTPNIDSFAKDGVLFFNAIVQAPWTLPSHMSLLTGLYPSSHGVMSTNKKLGDEHLTIAEILQNAGYETAAFTDGAYLSRQFGYQGFDRFDDTGYGIEAIYIKASNWLRKDHSRPFFLFLHTYQVHAPYDPPPDYDIYSDKGYKGIVNVSGNSNDYYKGIKPKMTLDDYRYVIDKYDGDIYYTDHFLGKLFKELRDLGLYDRSIIVLTADHGENFLDHPNYNIDHKELYDEVVKVPLIIKAPTFPRGRTLSAQVESIDIMPTVLELLRIPLIRSIDGESLVGLVEKGSYDRTFAFSEKSSRYKAIRSNDWKLIRRSQTELELYNLKSDPGERSNLLSENPGVARSLYEELDTWIGIQNEKSKLYTASEIQLDSELTKKLKALGYVN